MLRPLKNAHIVIASEAKQSHNILIIHPPAADFVVSLLAMTKTAVFQRSHVVCLVSSGLSGLLSSFGVFGKTGAGLCDSKIAVCALYASSTSDSNIRKTFQRSMLADSFTFPSSPTCLWYGKVFSSG